MDERQDVSEMPPGSCAGSERPIARSNLTRVFHLLLILTVIHQLVGSEFMELPFPGDPPGVFLSLHEYLGILCLVLVTLFWLWTLIRRGETRLSRLFPWFSSPRIRDVLEDLAAHGRRLMQGQAPDEGSGALASATHGLGLVAVAVMAATGTVYFFAESASIRRDALDLHKLLSNFVWAYLFAHAGLATLHHMLGSDILRRMFWVRPRRALVDIPTHLESLSLDEFVSDTPNQLEDEDKEWGALRLSPTDGVSRLCLARAVLCRESAIHEDEPSRKDALNRLAEKWEQLAALKSS